MNNIIFSNQPPALPSSNSDNTAKKKIDIKQKPCNGKALEVVFRDYLISMTCFLQSLSQGAIFGNLIFRIPFFTLASMCSLSTLSGRIMVCSNLLYENSRRKKRPSFFFSLASLCSSGFSHLPSSQQHSLFFSMRITRLLYSSPCTSKSSLHMPGAAMAIL